MHLWCIYVKWSYLIIENGKFQFWIWFYDDKNDFMMQMITKAKAWKKIGCNLLSNVAYIAAFGYYNRQEDKIINLISWGLKQLCKAIVSCHCILPWFVRFKLSENNVLFCDISVNSFVYNELNLNPILTKVAFLSNFTFWFLSFSQN